MNRPQIRSTTILAIRHNGKTVVAGDGQVTLGSNVIKGSAKKVRRINDGRAVTGFAGSAADGMTLYDRFDAKMKECSGNVTRAVVELAKDWRTDKFLRRLEAMMIIASTDHLYLVSGTGDVIEPDDGVIAIGSGGPYALAAAKALLLHAPLDARQIAEAAMKIAAQMCIYTNEQFIVEELS